MCLGGSNVPAGLCGPKTTNHGPIIACVGYISPAHPQASPVREQRAVHKFRLDLCRIKASAELVVMVLDVESVRAVSSKGAASKSISKKTKQQVRAQTLAKLAVPQLAVLPRLIILDTPAMATASAPAVDSLPKGLSAEEERSVMLMWASTPAVTRLLMVLYPAVSQIQTSCPVHEEDKEVLQNKVHAQDTALDINFDI